MPAPIRMVSAAARHALRNAVFPEPLEQFRPGVPRGGFDVALTIIREETVPRLRIDDDLRVLAGIAERLPHPLHLFERDAVVLAAVKADDRRLQLRSHVESGSRPILVLQSD